MKLVLGVSAALVGGVLFIFGGMIATDPADNIRLSAPGAAVGESGVRLVIGTLRNHTGNHYARVEFEIDLLDETGGWIGGRVVGTEDLGPKETWEFQVAVPQENAAKARLRDLRCSKTGEEPRPRACFFPPTLIELPSTS